MLLNAIAAFHKLYGERPIPYFLELFIKLSVSTCHRQNHGTPPNMKSVFDKGKNIPKYFRIHQ